MLPTILFVDDENAVRDVVVGALAEKAFRVFAAASGSSALRILDLHHVDLLLADVVMPGMDGVELARRARVKQPNIKVLLATGYADRAAEREAQREGRVLFKPMRLAQVVREVEATLAAP